MITEIQLTRVVRLLDYYSIDKDWKYFLWFLKEKNPNLWYQFASDLINSEIKRKIDSKIKKYKRFCKKSNKRQYLTAYKNYWYEFGFSIEEVIDWLKYFNNSGKDFAVKI